MGAMIRDNTQTFTVTEPMSINNRQHERHSIHVDVTVTYEEDKAQVTRTRDISDGGMFLELDNSSAYPMGEMVHIQYKNPFRDNMDTHLDAIIVRVADDGIGIAFVEIEGF